ncbi:hypothetical protein [Streptomyces sp. 35G-GA-8]|uniref:hypothetical protein n=1 Tax=Streptomyces sp. 35G-GA-8 TaxID=2939434 RepID=UPI00201F91FC|nr:hypothetical protein [Streptomyces sp. 35G-GA-8]MCL7380751.1 hypothetical protein [Streptomyces sp. 35G-GA-8]
MEPELAALAGTAGTTLVTLLATDTWQSMREGLLLLWRRARPDRAQAIAGELDSSRDELLIAQASGDLETEAEIRAEWQGRVRRLLTAHPELAEDLSALLAEVAPGARAQPLPTQQATASGEARIYQAGRDLHLDQR